MASLTMTASFLTVARPSSADRRKFAPAKTTVCSQKVVMPTTSNIEEPKEKESNTRRGIMLAAAAAIWAAGSVPEMAAVAEEPRRGTPEAKKKYFPVCVTMPTARICYK
ncbi:photosystem II 5 kDa protein, chloroplastic [Dendrobium catenatum]|uniref:Photosystem II 5 kDa protein, chloroplastic n=1 Tax=Dendrobium catenatum TaxID=906689 RepID=A0A2I0WVP7_9ASPA|nr:photosystem II 5 kDa protein, chloroplastic [Dendrobium catenatum]PKU79740.1 Photosystem II 5 kDa protein, chloroplastic [Dendrobium catenatum]